MKKLIYTLIAVCICQIAFAQDPLFKQFYASPVYTNPALTGVFKGSWRVNANYRQQWTSSLDGKPFRTVHTAFDMRIPIVSEDYIAFGVNLLYDNVGYSNLGRTGAGLSISYLKNLGGFSRDGSQFLVLGASAGMNQFKVDISGLTFDNQYNSAFVDFDPNKNSNEFAPASNQILGLNGGILWYAVFDKNSSLYFGASMMNINSPKVSFYNVKALSIPRRISFQAGSEIPFNDNLSIIPAAYFNIQGPSMATTFGMNLRYSNNDYNELAIRAGVFNTLSNKITGILNDGLTFSTFFELEKWSFGLSYDVHTSSITTINNGRGALELSVIYRHPEVKKYKVECPNF
jgi:type IX secretion system PorP/SprF family membrane protein